MARNNKNQAKNETNTTKVQYRSVRKKEWHDLQDNGYVYKQGDIFPREGVEVSEERIKELSTINNKLGEILIQRVEIEEDNKQEEVVGGEETKDVEVNSIEETENIETNNVDDAEVNSEADSTEEDKEETENSEE